ncbi:M16 family metallopeptidase [Lyngbya confervoides]|uniref:Insulinase family protein n=1 Tax=Lyngbya confervoides BDU141951 TaxID=1574623 RepID=A0ABD4T8D7_9CYAN|nr:pitrilysin family protein [Lyngbya confervoides]MCM1984748.1 insulinase family protein [Lyngbya confervoides BDU141951]
MTAGPTRYQTASGLTIIAEQTPTEAVNFSLWIRAGSAVESKGQNGMAHFLEHMIFKGTPNLAPGEFERQVEARGGVMNALTSQDYTCFYCTVAPSDFAAIAPLQIELVLKAQIPETEFERERQVVLEEIRRAEDNPRHRIFSQTLAAAFPKSPYGRPILGPAPVIQSLTPEAMRQHHRTHYHAANLTAVVVGNLPPETLIERVKAGFAPHLKPTPPPAHLPPWPEEVAITRAEEVQIYDRRLTQARLIMLWHVPGLSQLESTYALDVLARILAHGRTSRLIQSLREQRGLVSSLSARNYTQAHQGLFLISAHLQVEHIPAVRDEILRQIQDLQTQPVPASQLQQIQRQVANQFIFANEAPASRAGLYGYSEAIAQNLQAGLNYPHRIRALSPEDIQQATQTYLGPRNYRLVTFTPKAT